MPRLSCHSTLFAALALWALAACQPAAVPTPAAPLPGLALRLAFDTPCLACETVPQRDPAAPPLYLKRRPLLTSADIEGITQRVDPFSKTPAIDFTFRPEAGPRIHDTTSGHVGGRIAWVADGQVFYVTRLSGPFSGSMMVTGLEAGERDDLFGLVTGIKAPRSIRPASTAPER